MAVAVLEVVPGRVPRSVITPFCQRNAWSPELPTTCPLLLMAVAMLDVLPGSVPRSVILYVDWANSGGSSAHASAADLSVNIPLSFFRRALPFLDEVDGLSSDLARRNGGRNFNYCTFNLNSPNCQVLFFRTFREQYCLLRLFGDGSRSPQ